MIKSQNDQVELMGPTHEIAEDFVCIVASVFDSFQKIHKNDAKARDKIHKLVDLAVDELPSRRIYKGEVRP